MVIAVNQLFVLFTYLVTIYLCLAPSCSRALDLILFPLVLFGRWHASSNSNDWVWIKICWRRGKLGPIIATSSVFSLLETCHLLEATALSVGRSSYRKGWIATSTRPKFLLYVPRVSTKMTVAADSQGRGNSGNAKRGQLHGDCCK